jgi:putative transposase
MPFLNNDQAKLIFLEELGRTRAKRRFRILGYVVMPEHVHLVLYPPEGMRLGLVVREMKSRSAKRFFSLEGPAEPGKQRVF